LFRKPGKWQLRRDLRGPQRAPDGGLAAFGPAAIAANECAASIQVEPKQVL